MKKLFALTVCLAALFAVSSCKKDKDNGTGTPSQTCRLKSTKQKITESGQPDQYSGFAIYYDNSGKIIRANQYDSLGNEDSANYFVLSYSGENLTDAKIYQDGILSINYIYQFNGNNRISKRSYTVKSGSDLIAFDQNYFYDGDNKITYSLQTIVIPFGMTSIKVKDSALYQNYNAKGRPAGIVVYRSTESQFGSQPYDFSKELAFEYDANGNRTKESEKDSLTSNPFKTTRTASFDAVKTANDANTAYRTLTRILADALEDPNLNTKNIDINLLLSEDSYDDNGIKISTKNTTYTFNDRNSPATSTEVEGVITTNSTFTYDCK